mmetsp:Transcript_8514/g.13413  ORF Transcript_8514/g.13413 Transcript_8514/m.13413 type:complete len:219 (-) Transcript_8514:737-1393(-)
MEDPKLLLQIDPRELFLLIDHSSEGASIAQSINLALAKIAYVKKSHFRIDLGQPNEKDYVWHDGTPLALSERTHQAHLEGQWPSLFRSVSRVSTTALSLESLKFTGTLPEGCQSFYSVFGRPMSLNFSEEGPGKIYLSVALDIKRLLVVPPTYPVVSSYSVFQAAWFPAENPKKCCAGSKFVCQGWCGEIPHNSPLLFQFACAVKDGEAELQSCSPYH